VGKPIVDCKFLLCIFLLGERHQKGLALFPLFTDTFLLTNRGSITALKLSPNLRKKVKPPKKGPVHTEREWEIMKLEKLLALVQEPPTLSPAPDLPAPANV
jgi:hypothetical protein